jgi:type II secretory pathway component PulF
MSDAVVKYEHDIKILMDEVARQVQAGADLGNLLEQLGQAHQDQIRAHIRSGEFTANAPSTIARKGSSVPLVDEGRHLIPAVHWVKI